jgi:hypothetical protein
MNLFRRKSVLPVDEAILDEICRHHRTDNLISTISDSDGSENGDEERDDSDTAMDIDPEDAFETNSRANLV